MNWWNWTRRPDRIKSGTRMRTVSPANCAIWISKRITLELRRTTRKCFGRKCSRVWNRDVLIVTGGVSMGEYDFVQEVFHDLGLEILFSKVAIKPGKPTVFARRGEKLVFGLPGNPISALITFECFVRPAIGRLCGMNNPELPRMMGELLADMKQTPGRTAFLPAWVSLERGWVESRAASVEELGGYHRLHKCKCYLHFSEKPRFPESWGDRRVDVVARLLCPATLNILTSYE